MSPPVPEPGREAAARSQADALARAAAAGIHSLAIPTPFLVGRVNCYLVEDDPLTLVDTGPNSGKSLDALERALAAHGRVVEDLELIVITHQHMDHLGLLEILARRSGAEVAALDALAPYLGDWAASATADDEFAQAVMLRHGVPEDLAQVLRAVGAAFRAFGSSGQVTRPLSDEGRLHLRDRSFTVLHRPGHSPSDTLLWDAERGIVLGGDHLLAHVSSNPLISRPLDGAEPEAVSEEGSLLTYLASLRRTRELPEAIVLGGHGPPVTDHRALVDRRLQMHRRRAETIFGLLGARELTAFDIAGEMWGNVAVTQAYLTLSEVLGHLDLLEQEGRVARVVNGAGVKFRRAE